MTLRKPHLVLVDNNDSFTFNVFQYLQLAGAHVTVRNCDEISPGDADFDTCDGIVISPGPGAPREATASAAILARHRGSRPILGICLGHQIIAEHFGARVVRAERVMHGKVSRITHCGAGLFRNLPQGFSVARYHSLIAEDGPLPAGLRISCHCLSPGGQLEIMGLAHDAEQIHGVQFHPEAIQTEHGLDLLGNFVALCAGARVERRHADPYRRRDEISSASDRKRAVGE
ncbi:anthranilate synthase component II [Tropicimonas marinistellae]|uniref:anthranilate synthase component II n=1 Tax=Tropicimonas marinistellae TaxID=1739787 RepID=UPI00098EAC8C|nr:aminodeoxychorismate/anthranilate synthase component II [Tropicimonas marinistellae]